MGSEEQTDKVVMCVRCTHPVKLPKAGCAICKTCGQRMCGDE